MQCELPGAPSPYWSAFARALLGIRQAADRGQFSFRMDERCWRLFVDPDDALPRLVIGWAVADSEAAVEAVSARLVAAGVDLTREQVQAFSTSRILKNNPTTRSTRFWLSKSFGLIR